MFLTGGGKALATVTAIIDGMGSCGAALGPVLTGHLVTLRGGFDNVFLMLYISAAAAGLLLSKLAYKEASFIHLLQHAKLVPAPLMILCINMSSIMV